MFVDLFVPYEIIELIDLFVKLNI